MAKYDAERENYSTSSVLVGPDTTDAALNHQASTLKHTKMDGGPNLCCMQNAGCEINTDTACLKIKRAVTMK